MPGLFYQCTHIPACIQSYLHVFRATCMYLELPAGIQSYLHVFRVPACIQSYLHVFRATCMYLELPACIQGICPIFHSFVSIYIILSQYIIICCNLFCPGERVNVMHTALEFSVNLHATCIYTKSLTRVHSCYMQLPKADAIYIYRTLGTAHLLLYMSLHPALQLCELGFPCFTPHDHQLMSTFPTSALLQLIYNNQLINSSVFGDMYRVHNLCTFNYIHFVPCRLFIMTSWPYII